MKNLIVVDLDDFRDIKINNSNILYLNKGKLSTFNCKIIKLNINENKKLKFNFLRDFEIFLNDLKKDLRRKLKFIDPQELEIFNLRNDKIEYIEKICLILNFLKLKKNFNSIRFIIDDKKKLEIYKQVLGKNFKYQLLDKQYPDNNFLIKFQFYKFIIKAFYFILLSKILYSKNVSKEKKMFLSIYPYFYNKKKQIDIYKVKNCNKINFSLTDESHLNLKISNYIGHLKKLRKVKNLTVAENYIKFKDLISAIKKFNIELKVLENYFENKKIIFRKINIKNLVMDHLWLSFLNRMKLSIYDDAVIKILITKKIKEFHYFLFEYCFGFYLSKILRTKVNFLKIKRFGYQHGIFSKKLLWLNLLLKDNKKNIFFPEYVNCNQSQSIKSYKKFSRNVIYKSIKSKNVNFPKINTKSNNILVFPGQHDLYDCYHYFIKNSKFKNNEIFIKLHPNNKKKIISTQGNIKIINKFNKNKNYQVFLSPTTTIAYQFKKKK